MPTDMHWFAQVAARYGVDPNDEDAVDDWYEHELKKLPHEAIEAIITELLEAEGMTPPRNSEEV